MLTGTRRTVLMLAGCQALSMTGGSIVGLTGAIVGNMLTPDKALSTLPIAVQQAGVMAATIPAALLMARIGRRPGFWLGTAIGGVGAVIATWAIFRSSFEWFCFGTFLLGANRGATQQYRFAAAEIADEASHQGIQLFRIRYPSPKVGASLFMDISGESLALQEVPTAGPRGRRFWVKIKHAHGTESMSLELVDGKVVRNLAAPDGTMAQRH